LENYKKHLTGRKLAVKPVLKDNLI
jgi:hypothetical protein